MQRVEEHQIQPPPPPPPAPSHKQAQQQQQQQQQPKALRFVTNYGAPHPKRRRIGAACLTCRKRKTACSGERPFCETCKQNKLGCAGYSPETAAPSHRRTDSDGAPRKAPEQHGNQRGGSANKGPYTPTTEHKGSGNESSRTLSGPQSPRTTTGGRDDAKDGGPGQDSLFAGPRNRMPYFRWLGPTAIMPGFKQMVVKVKRHDTNGHSSTDGGMQSPSLNNLPHSDTKTTVYAGTPAAVESDLRTPSNLPFYDTSPMPPSELITHLANTFFTHLGCNYPFLQRERFLRDLEEKQVDAILVDAVCALAARFSNHSLLTQMTTEGGNKSSPAEYGHAFAQRAKTALTDAFPCPTVAAAQAALLLAYNEFGEQRDSGLWMYLGISIRLAQDLGLHKLEGLRYVGKDGPTPKAVKRASQSGDYSSGATIKPNPYSASAKPKESEQASKEQTPEDQKTEDETRAVEQERVDTFWAIFFLDRVVSSGTGRRSTLRDKDIELSFPPLSQKDKSSDWPAPFPALIRIIHLYGRVADLLNSIKEPSDFTTDTPKRLASMESQVTNFYQNLSPRLHFDAVNFQHYMKAGEGTNFVLLHFWFHTLIILLHQPTLLKTFEGRMLQLFPNSQQLAMSSAKTIADILSYSQLMDAKASLGNPFTTQPIYIAGCAFLRESVEQTASSTHHSRATSPSRSKDPTSDATTSVNGASAQAFRKASISQTTTNTSAAGSEGKPQLAKHTLLATAASQHYQLCYKALQSLETFWAGTKYILTIMDQKFEGNVDPLLYTTEEAESSLELPRPEPAFTSPGWRRKLSWGPYAGGGSGNSDQSPSWPPKGLGQVPGSPRGVDPSKAIGWTLTGTMNSPSTNLAWHYASGGGGAGHNPNLDPRLSSVNPAEYDAATGQLPNAQYPRHPHAGSTSSQRLAAQEKLGRQAMSNYAGGGTAASNGEAESILGVGSPYNQPGGAQSPGNPITGDSYPASLHPPMPAPTSGGAGMNGNVGQSFASPAFFDGPGGGLPMSFASGDMMIEQQDVDMSMLGLEMMPWFVDSYPTQDMMGMFDPNGQTGGGAQGSGSNGASGRQ
ncbi:related to C6 transcription factor [Lecanosticta acicola]|uniref:Related to C6 transcription factor n=1 Tax=Lecanosticta acicola TaxID=111012 RepID=A0AAI8YS10_9PEZI|nr:related to C6 transcription factor [Lecanosticta acicola]